MAQVYVGGEFMGGADVCREMAESGELQPIVQKVCARRVLVFLRFSVVGLRGWNVA